MHELIDYSSKSGIAEKKKNQLLYPASMTELPMLL